VDGVAVMYEDHSGKIDSLLEKAYTALAESKCLHDNGFTSGTVSRAYTACYHSAVAALLSRDMDIIKPSAMAVCFDRELVRGGYIEKRYQQLFAGAHRHKQVADIDEETAPSPAEAVASLEAASEFVQRVEKYLRDYGFVRSQG